jgi:chemotaxis protein methyltransferase CheR
MVVDMLLPERNDWDILILGSDINQAALAKARRGLYGKWSFRMVAPELQQRYFRRIGDEWELDERIRRMVTFRVGDLIDESSSSHEWRHMDLILCRNVFIYFAAAVVNAVAVKLAGALSEGGYLMTGHTELIGHRVGKLRSRLFAEGVVYQRVAAGTVEISPPAPIASPQTVSIMPRPDVEQQGPEIIQPGPDVEPPAPPSGKKLLAIARQFADRGEYEQAEQSCRLALAAAPLTAGGYFLLAQLAQLKGDFTQAGELLDKTIYLDPHCVAAYLELAALCERAEKLPKAQNLRRAALNIVRSRPGDTMIEPYETTAAEMAEWLAQ